MPPSLCPELSAEQKDALLGFARASIGHGIKHGKPLFPASDALDPLLQTPTAVFVTLTCNGELRGCIGSLQAQLPLAEAVAQSAFNAALADRRFAPVTAAELENLDIEIALLSEMQPIRVENRQELLEQLEPGIDGLLLEDGFHRATFLPKVWEKIVNAEEFLGQLLLKAGLGAGHWSSTISFQRYHTLSFGENETN